MHRLLTVLCLSICFACSNMGNEVEQEPDLLEDMDKAVDRKIRYLALGDSYTIGERVAETERWPVLLADTLSKSGRETEAPEIVATTGWTTAELDEGILKAGITPGYNLVSLLIGVNNQYRGVEKGYTLSGYAQEFEELLQKAISFAENDRSRVFVLSIPDYGVTPFVTAGDRERIGKELDAYNAAAKSICVRYGIPFHNITDISRMAAHDTALVAPDGLHPSGKMYKMWVEAIADSVLKQLPD